MPHTFANKIRTRAPTKAPKNDQTASHFFVKKKWQKCCFTLVEAAKKMHFFWRFFPGSMTKVTPKSPNSVWENVQNLVRTGGPACTLYIEHSTRIPPTLVAKVLQARSPCLRGETRDKMSAKSYRTHVCQKISDVTWAPIGETKILGYIKIHLMGSWLPCLHNLDLLSVLP